MRIDEMPHKQVLERHPVRQAMPSITSRRGMLSEGDIAGCGGPFFLIPDGGASPIAIVTDEDVTGGRGWWRPRLTPAHASWLNQAEWLNHAFGHRSLKRGSWSSRQESITHVLASWPESNRHGEHHQVGVELPGPRGGGAGRVGR